MNPPWSVSMTRCVPELKQEFTAQSMGFNLFGMKSRPWRVGYFCS